VAEAAALSERLAQEADPNPNPNLAQEADRLEHEALAAKRGRMAREADLLRMQLGLPPLAQSPLFAPVTPAPARR
jgi:hypothetical protein